MNAAMVTHIKSGAPALMASTVPTMSSREIADLVESRHDDVKRSIERLAIRGVIQLPPVAEVRNHLGQNVSEFHICKRDSYVIVAQLSPEFTARLVDRWQELENRVGIPTTFPEALRLAAEQAEQIQAQQAALAAAAPKVEFVDRYASANGSKGFREVCKLLGANEARFRLFLLERKIAYRLDGTLTPYQQHIDAGRFEVKTGLSHANDRAFSQMRFTPKGINWIAGEWGKIVLERDDEAGGA